MEVIRGHLGCPLSGGCPIFGGSAIGGSTVQYLSYHFYLCNTSDILEKVENLSLHFEDSSFMIRNQ